MNKRILLIEDENALRQDIAEILTFEGYNVSQAENGKVGFRLALETSPDLILCDIMMPEMDGFEVLAAVRENLSTRLTPFIMLTALADRENFRSVMEQGADDYIAKPVGIAELLNAIQGQFRKSDDVSQYTESALDNLRHDLVRKLPSELSSPLEEIIAFGKLMQEYSTSIRPAKIAEYGKKIYEGGIRIHRSMQNYLLYAQFELNSVDITQNRSLEDVELLCRQIGLETAKRYERMHDLQLNTTSTLVNANPEYIKKIVEELADNAFKFSKSGSPVQLVCNNSEGDFQLLVIDRGSGISQNDIKKIGAHMQFGVQGFEKSGIGLGLIIAKRITQMYSGEFEIESTVNKGTYIKIKLPAK